MKACFSILVFFTVAIISPAAAQNSDNGPAMERGKLPKRFYLGVSTGLLRNFYPGGVYNPHDIPEIGHVHEPYGSSNAGGIFFGASAEYRMGDPASLPAALTARILYSKNFRADFSGKEEQHPTIQTDTALFSLTRFYASTEYSDLALQIQYQRNLWSDFFVSLGTEFIFSLDSRVEYRQSVIEQNNAVIRLEEYEMQRGWSLSEDNRTVFFPARKLAPFRFALIAGMGYEFQMQPLIIAPQLLFRAGLHRDKATNLLIHSLQLGLDLRYAL